MKKKIESVPFFGLIMKNLRDWLVLYVHKSLLCYQQHFGSNYSYLIKIWKISEIWNFFFGPPCLLAKSTRPHIPHYITLVESSLPLASSIIVRTIWLSNLIRKMTWGSAQKQPICKNQLFPPCCILVRRSKTMFSIYHNLCNWFHVEAALGCWKAVFPSKFRAYTS